MLIDIVIVKEASYGSRGKKFHLEEISISPERVIRVEDNSKMKQNLLEGLLPEDLQKDHDFSTLYLDAGGSVDRIIAVGSRSFINEKLFGSNNKKILKG